MLACPKLSSIHSFPLPVAIVIFGFNFNCWLHTEDSPVLPAIPDLPLEAQSCVSIGLLISIQWFTNLTCFKVYYSSSFSLVCSSLINAWPFSNHQKSEIWESLPNFCLFNPYFFSSVQSLSHVRLLATPWTAACQASLSITNSQSSPKLVSIESVMPSSHLTLCSPLLVLPSIFPNIRVFSNESALRIRWPKDWSFSFNIRPSNEHSGLISFRMDWLDFLAVQGTLKSLLQHHSSKASVLQCSGFFIFQLSHPYMTTGKTIAFTRRTFVGKVMSLLFKMLCSWS